MFKVELKPDRNLDKYKARLVVKDFWQVDNVNFFEIFSPMVKHTTIHVVLTLVVFKGWLLKQVDVNNAFLNRDLIEDIFMA